MDLRKRGKVFGSLVTFCTAAGEVLLTAIVIKKTSVVVSQVLPLESPTTRSSAPKIDLMFYNESGSFDSEIMSEVVAVLSSTLYARSPGAAFLLFFDNCSIHENLTLLSAAGSKGVQIFFLPPNTTHFLQPLDRTVFAVFKVWLAKRVRERKLTESEESDGVMMCSIVDAMTASFKKEIICSGWEKTGLWPFNKGRIIELAKTNDSQLNPSTSTFIQSDIVKKISDLLESKKRSHEAGVEVVQLTPVKKKMYTSNSLLIEARRQQQEKKENENKQEQERIDREVEKWIKGVEREEKEQEKKKKEKENKRREKTILKKRNKDNRCKYCEEDEGVDEEWWVCSYCSGWYIHKVHPNSLSLIHSHEKLCDQKKKTKN